MNEVEDRLRSALIRRAEQAPPGAMLLQQLRRTHGRRRRRRLVLLGGGLAAVLVTGSVLVVPQLTGPGGGDLALARPASVPAGLPAPGVSLAPGDPYRVAFPLRPGAGLTALGQPVVTLMGGVPTLSYRDGAVSVAVYSGPPADGSTPPTSPPAGGTVSPPTGGAGRLPAGGTYAVDGHPASLVATAAGQGRQTLTWQRGLAQWVRITASAATSAQTLLGYAGGLSAGAVAMTEPYTFTLVPVGMTVDNVTPAAVTFCPAGVAESADFVDKITVMLADSANSPPTGQPVLVGGRPAWLGGTGFRLLQVPLAEGDTLQIQVPATIPLGTADLLRFAAGIRPTAAAKLSLG